MKMSGRKRNPSIRQFIIEKVADYPTDITRMAVQELGISRQAVHRHLGALIREGVLKGTGVTRGIRYTLNPLVQKELVLKLADTLDEEKFWMLEASPLLKTFPPNVQEICYFGITEMIKNAAAYSGGRSVVVAISVTTAGVELWVKDDGVGIFEKISRAFRLEDHRRAALELAKGRLSTNAQAGSGRAIVLASHLFDQLSILSGSLCFVFPGQYGQWLYDGLSSMEGTAICMKVSARSDRTLSETLKGFAARGFDAGLTRAYIPVALLQALSEPLISRFQARDLLSRCEQFNEIVLDFAHVETVGQPFADEIARVFAAEHPETRLSWVRASERVESVLQAAVIRKVSLLDSDSAAFPFRFRSGDRVRSRSDRDRVGTIKDGRFEGQIDGPHEIIYVVDLQNGVFFRAAEADLEKAEEISSSS